MSAKKILIYGGRGALGSTCVKHFRSADCWVANVDIKPNDRAHLNITVPEEASWEDQEEQVTAELTKVLKSDKLNAIFCVAGGFAAGNITKNVSKQADLMWRQSVWSSSIAAIVASKYLCPGGVLALSGAKSALNGTPDMIGYGMAKAAVHQLAKSLGAPNSGMPKSSLTVAILPDILDTEVNRRLIFKADCNSWTPLSFVAELFEKWLMDVDRPPNGSLVTLMTAEGLTQAIPLISKEPYEKVIL